MVLDLFLLPKLGRFCGYYFSSLAQPHSLITLESKKITQAQTNKTCIFIAKQTCIF